jgi:lactoylglutathione lyase
MTQGIHHVAIRVTDLERSVAFYERHFDLRVASRMTLASGGNVAFLVHPAGGAQLELIAGLTDHHPGDGLVHHVAFGADDVPAVFEQLRAAGVATLEEAPVVLANGRRLFSCRGPDGERLQVSGA